MKKPFEHFEVKESKTDWEKELRQVIETAASVDDCDDIECGIRYVRSLLSHQRQEILEEIEKSFVWTQNYEDTDKLHIKKLNGDMYIHIEWKDWLRFKKEIRKGLKSL